MTTMASTGLLAALCATAAPPQGLLDKETVSDA